MLEVEISQTKNQIEVLLETAINGEEVLITKNSQPILKITRVDANKPLRRAGSAKGQIVMTDDFDAPLEDFREYMS